MRESQSLSTRRLVARDFQRARARSQSERDADGVGCKVDKCGLHAAVMTPESPKSEAPTDRGAGSLAFLWAEARASALPPVWRARVCAYTGWKTKSEMERRGAVSPRPVAPAGGVCSAHTVGPSARIPRGFVSVRSVLFSVQSRRAERRRSLALCCALAAEAVYQ